MGAPKSWCFLRMYRRVPSHKKNWKNRSLIDTDCWATSIPHTSRPWAFTYFLLTLMWVACLSNFCENWPILDTKKSIEKCFSKSFKKWKRLIIVFWKIRPQIHSALRVKSICVLLVAGLCFWKANQKMTLFSRSICRYFSAKKRIETCMPAQKNIEKTPSPIDSACRVTSTPHTFGQCHS